MTPDVNVVPVRDLREHVETRACWCAPRIEFADHLSSCAVVVHHSLDGRELVERHGLQ